MDICIKYLLLEEIGTHELFGPDQKAVEELPQEVDLFEEKAGTVEYDPHCTWESWEENMIHYDLKERGFGGFFAYASSYWVEHLAHVTDEPHLYLDRIERLCCAGPSRLCYWIEQNRRPGCTLQPRSQFDAQCYDPLSIMCLYGSSSMLNCMLETSDFTKQEYL